MSDDLAALLAKRFIARRDVKAIQHPSGAYTPVEDQEGNRVGWKMDDLRAHLAGTRSYGHYLLDHESKCKFFAFDIDLEKNNESTGFTGWLPTGPDFTFEPADAREAWRDRKHVARPWMKLQFKLMANKLMRVIHEELEIPCAAAYSGSKGIHVYGFTGYGSAYDARTGANIVLDLIGEFKAVKGNVFFKHVNDDPLDGYPNLSIEVFPKQDTLSGKDLGNLLRLPLGRNLKSKDPTFFIDMTTAIGEMSPVDPTWALGMGSLNPWQRPGD